MGSPPSKRRTSLPIAIPPKDDGPTSISVTMRRLSLEGDGWIQRHPKSNIFSRPCRDLGLPQYGKSPPPEGVVSPRDFADIKIVGSPRLDPTIKHDDDRDARSPSPLSVSSAAEEEPVAFRSPSPSRKRGNG